MIINLLGPQVVVHPYADQGREALSILTYDTRESVLTRHNGLVYEERVQELPHPFIEELKDHYIIEDNIMRTNVVLYVQPRTFRCHHEWRDPEVSKPDKIIPGNQRSVTLKLQDGMLAVQEDKDGTLIVMDLALELELKTPGEQDLWDHLTA